MKTITLLLLTAMCYSQPKFINTKYEPVKEVKIIKLIGKVIDCHTKHPIYSVKITAGNKTIHTEMDGKFKIQLEQDELLKFEFLGKETYSVPSEHLINTVIEL